jgi:biotin carboxyl carrier protein
MSDKKLAESDSIILQIEERSYETLTTRKFESRKPYRPPDPKKILCFIPGVIRKLYVSKGARVSAGDRLMMLEAMKMQNDIVAHRDGKIKHIPVVEGMMATKGQVLIEFD